MILFQSLIGTIKTERSLDISASPVQVSIPHRYDKNASTSRLFALKFVEFQSLIGTIKTMRRLYSVKYNLLFQSLIGTIKTVYTIRAEIEKHMFQSLIGTIKTGASFLPS